MHESVFDFLANPKYASARELLVRHGSREDVGRNLIANFYSEGWSGRASAHYARKLETIQGQKTAETHPDVLKWLAEYEDSLERQIERERKQEEREGF